ncbi:CpaD family pilus assembly protein [Chelativorans sp. Marseille-P2723]|uniref:CpaD family pilus assembly protein n=1 Tax=Chelativorans sp. Marseille-P2723 TaxID=2709133 RepID=UPI0015706C21|nr:CpaD family pilus assembly protein [Chelativorans sp. Marseille-P2723]
MTTPRMKWMAAVVAVAGVLAGCTHRDSVIVGAVPDDYRTNHPIVLTEGEEVLDIPVGILSYRLSGQQEAAIAGFMDNYGESGKSVVTILVPDGAANSPAAASVSREMATSLRKHGVPQGYVQILAYQASPADVAPIRLTFSRLKATVGPCGRWPADLTENYENRHYANFGCAYQNNLAAQVANPMDLLGPRKMTTIDAENRGHAINDYKNRRISESFWENSEVFYD